MLLAAFGMLVATAGCSVKNPHEIGTYERAQFWVDNERYQLAADAFEAFVRQNPTDTLAAEAQYGKARALMGVKEYPLAAVELQILAQDYPISPLVEDANFREGECYWFQVGRLERDVAPAYEARLHWLDFASRYPTSRYMPQVREYMQEIADVMVRKQLRAVRIYQQLRRHDSVALVLDRILEEEPTSGLLDNVLYERARSAEKLDDSDTARSMYRRIVVEYPESIWSPEAQAALDRLGEAVDHES